MANRLTAAGLAALRSTAARYVGDDRVPGLVALVASGDEVHIEALGRLSVSGPPVVRDTLWRIASVTKPVTGSCWSASPGIR